ncbi:RNA polymerase sigma factor [Qingshengfaniella alkalisoli]|uniref:RNA polymerase sigma factor n=1 Tax=Qingshengfaniella alkalisoli TaxID=2599296 RepID=A0A5B8IVK5_9RHOB|nr:RNA polymerase sigma factor [Qingshengfaniella alkalisoli]QDY69493.1 RNA polymerase sigma factor [Qingshengfaniella alkalisoli]
MPFEAAPEASDEDLLMHYAAGDAHAARVLTARLAPGVYRCAVRMLGDAAEAEDVTQDAMLRLWRQAPNWEHGRAQPSTWLYRVASNLCLDRLRRKTTQPWPEGFDPASQAPSTQDRMEQAERVTALKQALGALPERQRQAVILRHIEGLTNPEVAAVMELSVEAVESLTTRGRRGLKGLLAGARDKLGFGDG